jgi:hypothetical protein
MEVGGQLKAPPGLPPPFPEGGKASGAHWMGGWERPRTDLDAVEKRKMSCLSRELNSDSSAVQAVGRCYTD